MTEFRSDSYEYESLYSGIPYHHEELVNYLLTTYNITEKDLKSDIKKINSIKWNEAEYTFYIVPRGTPRPRSSGHFYVKGAKEMKKYFSRCLRDEKIICTNCHYKLEAYFPTPLTSMTKKEVILAEKKLIIPLSTPDFDNLAKTYTDALQDILILNDNLISSACVEKYYSIKPRIKILLRWQSDFDSNYNRRKIESSIKYQNIHKENTEDEDN